MCVPLLFSLTTLTSLHPRTNRLAFINSPRGFCMFLFFRSTYDRCSSVGVELGQVSTVSPLHQKLFPPTRIHLSSRLPRMERNLGTGDPFHPTTPHPLGHANVVFDWQSSRKAAGRTNDWLIHSCFCRLQARSLRFFFSHWDAPT